MRMAGSNVQSFEFQRLHGMGDLLYSQVSESTGVKLPLRVYAPVGVHSDLLPYLVRRLLENGANGSFVNQFLDGKVPAENLVRSAEATIDRLKGNRNSLIPLADDLFIAYGEKRDNSKGIDLDDPLCTSKLQKQVEQFHSQSWQAGPIINGIKRVDAPYSIVSPADKNRVVGQCTETIKEEVQIALQSAADAQPAWQNIGAVARSQILDQAADLLEQQTETLTTLISFEAGRTLGDGLSEVREAVDFCRYYALQARLLAEQHSTNSGLSEGKGVFVCISPWNFPLAIFVGQVAAALVTGNSVIAKPAEQTPIIACFAIELLHQAGVPVDVLQLLTGTGANLGPQLMDSHLVAGVAFTGSTETAQRIQADLVNRGGKMPPFIAETGGQNVMIVDSTALPEQVVDSVIQSAFLSAGQRCSALRVLYLQSDIADNVINMLKGAIDTLKLGYPWQLSSDIGPVIDEKALGTIQDHQTRMLSEAKLITQETLSQDCINGTFVVPQVYELQHINELKREVFGPVLHLIRFKANQLDKVIDDVNNTGYGLTLGIHSRIKQFSDQVFEKTKVGNTYINRNMVGAVVGVNPFGGHGLSGTGFKAGGPHYLLRFSNLWNSVAVGQSVDLDSELIKELSVGTINIIHRVSQAQNLWDKTPASRRTEALSKTLQTMSDQGLIEKANLAICQDRIKTAQKQFSKVTELPGPTGETNELTLHGRGVVMVCVDLDTLSGGKTWLQLFSALAAGNSVVFIGRDQKSQDSLSSILGSAMAHLPNYLVLLAESVNDFNGLLSHNSIALVACG
jgi:RHH-type proline utilization regulon transcriptional repressor/proline dehydrogenase/delta 1-pyrroline-5-carboxylate dehydrogenase